MRFLLWTFLCNAACFGLLAYPAYSWRGEKGLVELGVAAAGAFMVFGLTLVLLHGRLKKPGPYASGIMMGKMGLHMIGMVLLLVLLPKLTGADAMSATAWVLILFFANLGVEVAYMLKMSRISQNETEKNDNDK